MLALLRFGPWIGWAAAVAMTLLWLNARDAIIEEREGCNADKLQSVVEAEQILRQAEAKAAGDREADLMQIIERERKAAEIASAAALAAESRPVEVREVIKRVSDANLCLSTAVPDDVLGSLRD